jgi:hypothetical protein
MHICKQTTGIQATLVIFLGKNSQEYEPIVSCITKAYVTPITFAPFLVTPAEVF